MVKGLGFRVQGHEIMERKRRLLYYLWVKGVGSCNNVNEKEHGSYFVVQGAGFRVGASGMGITRVRLLLLGVKSLLAKPLWPFKYHLTTFEDACGSFPLQSPGRLKPRRS